MIVYLLVRLNFVLCFIVEWECKIWLNCEWYWFVDLKSWWVVGFVWSIGWGGRYWMMEIIVVVFD